MKKLSVITVCYNLIKAKRTESFKRCLESVHNQTYQNVEHIIVDGASDDGTLEIIKEYSKKGWIKYISQKDAGIYDAMTKGTKIASGDYIYFLNTDDYFYDNNVVEDIINKFDETNTDAVFGNLMPYVLEENSNYLPVFTPGKVASFEMAKNKNLLLEINLHHQTIFYKKEIFNKVSFFSADVPKGSDWLFHCRAFLKEGYKYQYFNRIITYFNLGGESTNANNENIWNEYYNLQNILKTEFSCYINKKDKEYKKLFKPHTKKRKIKFLGLTLLKTVYYSYKKEYYLFGFLKILKKEIKSSNKELGTNKIILVNKNREEQEIKGLSNLSVQINGERNVIKLYEPLDLKNTHIEISGDDNLVELNKTTVHFSLGIHLLDAKNKFVKIGSSIIESMGLCGINNSCQIGDGCIIAANNTIWFSDGHSVYDNKTKEIINYTDTPLYVGNHVWLGQDVKLTKNASIPSNSIVGMGSIVTKKFNEENVCIAGNPAKIVKRNINWDGISPDKYKNKEKEAMYV